MIRPPPRSTLFPYTTLFRSAVMKVAGQLALQFPEKAISWLSTLEATGEEVDGGRAAVAWATADFDPRSEEHTSELQSRQYLVCRLLLEKKKDSRRKERIITE